MSCPTQCLTDVERNKLDQFKYIMGDVHQSDFDDYYYLRWLIARNYDLRKAELMLRNHLRWRKLNKVDSILEEYRIPAALDRYTTGGQFGQDREGNIVIIDPFGNIDLKGLLMCVKKRDMILYKIWFMEGILKMFKEKSAEQHRKVYKMVIIFDAENLGMHHLWKPGLDVVTESMTMFEEHYPEVLKKVYVINTPKVFSVAFGLVKAFISQETKKRITLCGADYKGTLLTDISPDELPAHWGGECRDQNGDPRCPSKIKGGGLVPLTYYFHPDQVQDLHTFTDVYIGKASTYIYPVSDVIAGTRIQWRFITEKYDISFGIYRKTNPDQRRTFQMEEVYPVMRVHSDLTMETGLFVCQHAGDYIIEFSNSYSYLKSKKLRFSVKVSYPPFVDEISNSGVSSC